MNSGFDVAIFTNEVEDVEFCMDDVKGFRGFRFKMFNEEELIILGIDDCDSWSEPVNLSRRRLIGFNIKTSECPNDCRAEYNIREI